MKLKANLHFHAADDPKDRISYSVKEGIDRAAELKFDVLALTCHYFFAWKKSYADYATQRGILLIPGIEVNVEGPSNRLGRHVVILNCDKEAEQVRTLKDIADYREYKPDIFILAPHPFYPHPLEKLSLKEHLVPNIDLFDAIELSWFYSKWFKKNNRKAEKIARKYKLPFIATSDTHFLEHLDFGYVVAEAAEKTPEAIFNAIKQGNFYNVTGPRKFWREMMFDYMVRKIIIGDLIKKNLGI